MLSHPSRVRLFVTLWTVATRLLCPWDSPGKNTRVGCHALLQGIFPTQGLNPVSYVSCISRRVLYHNCQLGAWTTSHQGGTGSGPREAKLVRSRLDLPTHPNPQEEVTGS